MPAPRPKGTTVLLAVIVAAALGLRLLAATADDRPSPSQDQRAYVVLGLDLADHWSYGGAQSGLVRALHWPPGAPAMIAAATLVAPPSATDRAARDVPSARYLQAVLSTLTVLAAFGIARRFAGDVAGLVAAGAVAAYPPLLRWSAVLVSEPLGTTLLALAVWAMVAAWPVAGEPLRRMRLVVTGVLIGAAVLTRADLLPLVVVLPAAVAAAARGTRWTRPALAAALPLAGAAILLVPWCTAVSLRAGRLTPVTTGDAAAFFVGTYLPGGGTTRGLKVALAEDVYRLHPALRGAPPTQIEGEVVIDAVARRHPGLDQEASLRREGWANIRRYALRRPVDFSRMVVRKTGELWGSPSRGGGPAFGRSVRVLQPLLVVGCLLLTLGAWSRTRDARLLAVLAPPVTATLVHAFTVTSARYNVPQMPLLLAAGTGAAFLLAARRRAPPTP